MKIKSDDNGVWYHGSDRVLDTLREGSSVTQWRELAEAFSHKPSRLSYDDSGNISHNGSRRGLLYTLDEPVEIGRDIYQHPNTTMDENAEFLTKRPIRVRLIKKLGLTTEEK